MSGSNKSPLGRRLKEARQAAEYSQKQLGIAAGLDEFVSSARMNQYETGKHVPDFVTLKNIALVLKLPTAYFYCDENRLADLIRQYARLDTKSQKALVDFALKLSENS